MFQVPSSRFQECSRFQVPCSRVGRSSKYQVPGSRFQVPSSEFWNRKGPTIFKNPEPGTRNPERFSNTELGTRNPERSGKAGFTLLELLISLTILGLIFVAVLGAIQVGSKSWESGEQRAEENLRNRTLYDTLARELTMLYPLRIKDQDKEVIAFHGSSDSLSFATLPKSYGAEPFSHMIRVVTYAVEPERGLVATESYPPYHSGDTSGSQEGRKTGFDERISEARFRYLVPEGKPDEKLPPTWRDFWDPSQDEAAPLLSQGLVARAGQGALKGSDRLPLAVEITLMIRQANQRGGRDLILPPLVFPVQVGRTL